MQVSCFLLHRYHYVHCRPFVSIVNCQSLHDVLFFTFVYTFTMANCMMQQILTIVPVLFVHCYYYFQSVFKINNNKNYEADDFFRLVTVALGNCFCYFQLRFHEQNISRGLLNFQYLSFTWNNVWFPLNVTNCPCVGTTYIQKFKLRSGNSEPRSNARRVAKYLLR